MNKFKINNAKLISTWSYNLPTNIDCTICRSSLNSDSIFAQKLGIDSTIKVGVCEHTFHTDCINPWLIHNKHCPLCSKNWIPKK